MSKSGKLGIGVIGLGVGQQHLEGCATHAQCQLIAACDIDPAKLTWAKEHYPNVTRTSDANELINDPRVDVVTVASYDDAHADQVVAAINAGKHVFVEKPLCQTHEQMQRIRETMKAHPQVRIGSNLILRRSPRFRRVKQMIDTGELGKLFYMEGDYNYGRLWKITEGWRGKLPFYSVVQGGGIHLIDLLMWLCGKRVTRVVAMGNAIASEGSQFKHKDLVVALLEFEDGLVAKVSSNFGCVTPHFHELSVFGTNATFKNGVDHGELFRSREAPPEVIDEAYPGYRKSELLIDFIDAIVEGRAFQVTEEEMFATMAVCFAIDRAAENGGSVAVRYV